MKLRILPLLALALHSTAQASTPDVEWQEVRRDLLQKCLLSPLPLFVDRQVTYVQLPIGNHADPKPAWFLLDTGATFSTIDAQFLNPAPLPAVESLVVAAPTREYTPASFEFFGKWFKSNFSIQDYSRIITGVKQAGIIGTDFLSQQPYILDFQEKKLYRTEQVLPCSPQDLAAAGLTALSTKGYYSTQGSTVSLSKKFLAPNVPTVPIRIGTETFVAQIDTGYNDHKHAFSININTAMKAALDQAGVGLIPVPRLNSTLTTAYRLAKGTTFSFVDINGQEVHPFSEVRIFLKSTPPAALNCGGISTWEKPAAQLGSSFFKDAGFVIFDPFTSLVWIPKTK